MNRKERIREELRETRLNFQRHDHDTGSSEVQGFSKISFKSAVLIPSGCFVEENQSFGMAHDSKPSR